jgi:hypothetical protein
LKGLNPNILRATKYAPGTIVKRGKGVADVATKIFGRDGEEVFLHSSSITCRHVGS